MELIIIVVTMLVCFGLVIYKVIERTDRILTLLVNNYSDILAIKTKVDKVHSLYYVQYSKQRGGYGKRDVSVE